MRLGWRITLFLVLFTACAVPVALVPIPGLPGRTLPVLVGALLAGWYLLALDGREPGALGFYLHPSALGEVAKGIGVGVVVGGMVILGMVGGGGLRWTAQGGSPAEYLREAASSLWLFTVPAAAEEALLRGYVFQALAEGVGRVEALWVTAILFGFLHFTNPSLSALGMVNLVVAGLFLGVVYLKTASLWWATGAHLGWNWALGFLADLPVSGLELVDAPLLEPRVVGPDWLTGGAFGPEGSLVATVLVGLAALVLWRTPRLAPGEAAKETRPLILSGAGVSPVSGGEEGTFEPDEFRRNP